MASIPRHRVTTVGAAVAIAASALGLPVASAHADPVAPPRAAVRLAAHPFTADRRLAHQGVPTVHLVRSGDTLSTLAQRYHTTVSAIRVANHLSGNRIVAGRRLTIPPASGGGDTSPHSTGSTPAKAPDRSLTVRSGDTLSGIAADHHITVKALRQANPGLHGNLLQPGQHLALPGAAPSHHDAQRGTTGTHHTKKVGRSFAGRTYDSSVTRAAQANKDALESRGVPSRAAMQQMVVAAAKANGVDPRLAQAIAYQESGFNMRAVSPANAVGVMQLIPSSVQWTSQLAGRTLDPLNPQDNVLAGVLLIKANLASTGWDVDKAVAGYYQGLGSVKANGLYADTKAYVASVKNLMGHF